VSTEVLSKPEALSLTEWTMMKAHPAQGAEILGCVPQLAGIAEVVRCHHERLDGSGYPDGLKGEAIPLLARIVSVCDAYDAMTSLRPYRGPMAEGLALGDGDERGGSWPRGSVRRGPRSGLSRKNGGRILARATP
jgi:HD-GYP domain-containing protein (c-di-GMP phosphodiesterase class II)